MALNRGDSIGIIRITFSSNLTDITLTSICAHVDSESLSDISYTTHSRTIKTYRNKPLTMEQIEKILRELILLNNNVIQFDDELLRNFYIKDGSIWYNYSIIANIQPQEGFKCNPRTYVTILGSLIRLLVYKHL